MRLQYIDYSPDCFWLMQARVAAARIFKVQGTEWKPSWVVGTVLFCSLRADSTLQQHCLSTTLLAGILCSTLAAITNPQAHSLLANRLAGPSRAFGVCVPGLASALGITQPVGDLGSGKFSICDPQTGTQIGRCAVDLNNMVATSTDISAVRLAFGVFFLFFLLPCASWYLILPACGLAGLEWC